MEDKTIIERQQRTLGKLIDAEQASAFASPAAAG